MKKLKLQQPYANMVAYGIIQSIPNIWGDKIHHGELIFIYASGYDEKYFDPETKFDVWKSMDIRKYHNATILSNAPHKFMNECFMGCVHIGLSGKVSREWERMTDCDTLLNRPVIFATNPKMFITPIAGFETDYSVLNKGSLATPLSPRKIKRRGDTLYVPVNYEIWEVLKTDEYSKIWGLYMEPYMENLIPNIFQENYDWNHQICDVVFSYGQKALKFIAHVDQDTWDSALFEVLFHLDGSGRLCEDKYSKIRHHIPGNCHDITNQEENTSEYQLPRPRFISTPMGGLNKWRK